MGIIDTIKNLGKQKENSSKLMTISTQFQPYRLNAHKNESIDLLVTVKNNDSKVNMISVVAKCPDKIGFGSPGINKTEQKKLGDFQPGEEKTVIFKVQGNSNTLPNDYPIALFVYSHFRDYDHVENAIRKLITLRAV
ncbi:hypothetical protein KO317_00735 [Candidatus Micrarchaeota archaeon]|jgi:hypothetical protein|nr:hypothetical protein [Candidatus Micrarchaeota archaeon]